MHFVALPVSSYDAPAFRKNKSLLTSRLTNEVSFCCKRNIQRELSAHMRLIDRSWRLPGKFKNCTNHYNITIIFISTNSIFDLISDKTTNKTIISWWIYAEKFIEGVNMFWRHFVEDHSNVKWAQTTRLKGFWHDLSRFLLL